VKGVKSEQTMQKKWSRFCKGS